MKQKLREDIRLRLLYFPQLVNVTGKDDITDVEKFTLNNICNMMDELMLDWDKNTIKMMKEQESAKTKTFRTDKQ